jgi:hypothetical protein
VEHASKEVLCLLGELIHFFILDADGFKSERFIIEFFHYVLVDEAVASHEQVHENRSQIPDSHGVVFIIAVLLPRDELRWLMLGAPQIFAVEPIGVAVIFIVDQAFQSPQLAAFDEVLGSQVSVPVPVHDQRIDGFDDLVEDGEAVFFCE